MRRLFALQTLCIVGIIASSSGCAPWKQANASGDKPIRETVGRIPDRISRDTIQLEVLLLKRPANDPLLGQILWDDVDEIGAVELDVRERLNNNGFRVGVAGTSIPHALETILQSSRKGLTFLPDDDRRLSAQPPVTLLAGTDTIVKTTQPGKRTIQLAGHSEDEEGESFSYDSAVCAFRIKASRLQDGWARLEFTPEVHHGENTLRHQANDVGWELKASQEIAPIYDQRFEIMLNVGETAIVSCSQPGANSPGSNFFESDKGEQRLLVVRLADLASIEGVSQHAR